MLVTQSHPTLWDPMHCSLPSFSVFGIFPGRNTGVSFHFLLQESSQPKDWTGPPTLQVDSLLPEPQGKPTDTVVGCHAFLQGNLPNPGIEHRSLHCRQFLYCLNHQGSPRILEQVTHPFSREPSQPINQTEVFNIAGRFFNSWATREAPRLIIIHVI